LCGSEQRDGGERFERFPASLGRDGVTLTLGCGSGAVGRRLPALSLEVTADDLAPSDGSGPVRPRHMGTGGTLVYLAVLVLILAGWRKVFVKAGKPGWAAIVPIYNLIVLLEVVGKPIWWLVLFLIPLVNIVVFIIVGIELARRFGRRTAFGVGVALLAFIFIPILGFGDAKYRPGPA
jgi:hypothetical protein